ncbi:MAG: hypothetical protein CL993_03770 [Euryarchaeota archaeon]|nr:hypothetical protein [Euryarchaeota archaeon]|tara:strand:+ start:155 stop:823 length:669 start_codon:yes stop_codon:yes gene_type:complete
MPRRIFLNGLEDTFYTYLSEKLLSLGAKIVDSKSNSDISVGIGINSIGSVRIIPANQDFEFQGGSVILIHDLIIPNGGNYWGGREIRTIIQSVINDEKIIPKNKINYWINVRDVVSAISTIIFGKKKDFGILPISGRRGWSDSDIISETEILWSRYNNSINNSHTIESLSNIPSPVRNIEHVSENRPNLKPVHDCIISCGGQGWHPVESMRTSIMELIAEIH